MNKKERQEILRRLIQKEKIVTQEALIQRLHEEGVKATQSTISRDMKELQITKLRDENQPSYYILPESLALREQYLNLENLIRENVVNIYQVQFVVIVRTKIDMANIIAAIIDDGIFSEVLGTIAGADTIAIFCQNEEKSQRLYELFSEMYL